MRVLENISPKRVFYYFEEICSVPHGSGNTKIISDKLKGMALSLGCECIQDELNNLIIKKGASAGYESCAPVILQGHMDMVCTKEDGIDKDMTKDGLDLIVNGDWLSAKGTSLGGDDGIAVAIAFAILEDETLKHPPIEVIVTVDEEVGMDGAFGIDLSSVKGRRLLNIDSEEEGVFTASCAGGLRADCTIPAVKEKAEGISKFSVEIGGLIGGHSGCEIEKGRGNANKLMARVLFEATKELESLRLCEYKGGQFDNVICPFCVAEIAVDKSQEKNFEEYIAKMDAILKAEYATADPGVYVKCSVIDANEVKAFTREDSKRILTALFVLPQSVIEMSMDIKGLPQTSLNLGVINTKDNSVDFSYSIRSSIGSQKMMVLDRVVAIVEMAGGNVSTRGMYPGWAFNRDSKFRNTLAEVFKRLNGYDAKISATHGGLECGLFIDKLPGLDCVSIGPDLRDIHSCGEKLSIASVERLYKLIVEFLAALKD